ncbi:MAG: hypothetical protein RLZZ467_535 [Gemmatimonadota bacterium]|jgi:hypothetical protein
MKVPVPAFALSRPRFPAPALLQAAAEAPHGGGREALMAGVMAVRLLSAGIGPEALTPDTRTRRAEAIRAWLPAVTLAPAVRTAVLRAVAASEGAEATTTAEAVVHLRDALDSMLTGAARRELSTLAAQFRRS